jgi:hypothetical protein
MEFVIRITLGLVTRLRFQTRKRKRTIPLKVREPQRGVLGLEKIDLPERVRKLIGVGIRVREETPRLLKPEVAAVVEHLVDGRVLVQKRDS